MTSVPGAARPGPRLRGLAAGWGVAGPLLLLWLAAMLATPFVERRSGGGGFAAWVGLTVLIQGAVALALLRPGLGTRPLLRLLAIVFGTAFAAEAIGAATDLPFGAYEYTALLQPQLLGVPLVIPVAWLMLLPSSWAVARLIWGRRGGLAFALLSGVALTAWDLFLDPQMVRWGVWRWDAPGAYFGIPLQNFGGWILVATLITLLVRPERLPGLPLRPLLVLYTLVAVIETVGLLVFWPLVGPALVGAAAMGSLAAVAWARLLRAPDPAVRPLPAAPAAPATPAAP
jgi:uncharacterized membrane protein